MNSLPINAAATSDASHAGRKLRVAVLMGGTSSEREISLNTGRQIVGALDPTKYDVVAIDTRDLLALQNDNPVGAQFIAPASDDVAPASDDVAPTSDDVAPTSDDVAGVMNHAPTRNVSEPDAIENRKSKIENSQHPTPNTQRSDLVFIALHGRGGEDGAVQGMLEVLGIPYTGSGILASALAMDKAMSKRLFRSANIPVANEILLSHQNIDVNALTAQIQQQLGGFPVFVKPNREGSTVGGTLVQSAEHLADALQRAFQYDTTILIEQYLRGMEITVGVLGNAGEELTALPVVEIVPKSEYYDFESKYADGGSEHIIPARLNEAQTQQVQELARQCHTLLGCRGMSRTDFIVTPDGPFALEVNTIPGMTPTSLLPQAAASAGIEFPELLDRIIGNAVDGRR